MKHAFQWILVAVCLLGIGTANVKASSEESVKDGMMQAIKGRDRVLPNDSTRVQLGADSTLVALAHALDSVVVTGEHITHYADRDVVRITREMRKGARNTAQMLGNIPGIDCDYSNNELKYYGSQNILILVDSIERSADYVKELHHLRYDKVDIIPNPLGKYEEYDVIINLHTKENYEGYEGNLSNSLDYLPTDGNGKDKQLKGDNAAGSFTYTRNKWNFVGRYNFNFHQHEKYMETTSINYVNRLQEDEVGKGKYVNDLLGHNLYTAIDYQVNKHHSLSASYNYSNTSTDNDTHRFIERLWLDTEAKDTVEVTNKTLQHNDRHTLGLHYRGNTGEWNYYYDFNYINEQWTYDRMYRQSSGYSADNNHDNRMDYIWMALGSDSRFFDQRLALGVEYDYTWKGYEQKDQNGGALLSANDYVRNNLHMWMSYRIARNTNVSLNASAQHIHNRSLSYTDNNMVYRMGGVFYHRWNDQIWMRVNYWNNVSYPSLNLVSEYGYFTDSLTWSGGNPALKTNVNHSGRVWVDFFNLFNVQMGYVYSPNQFSTMTDIGEGILPSGEYGQYIVKMPQNTAYQEGWASFSIFKRVKAFTFSAYLRYCYLEASYKERKQTNQGFNGNVIGRYYNEKHRLTVSLGYYLNNGYVVVPEGWKDTELHFFNFFCSKDFFNQRLNASVKYVLPFLPKDYTESESKSLIHYNHQYLDTRAFDAHALLFTLAYRFHGGKSVRQYNRSMQNEK